MNRRHSIHFILLSMLMAVIGASACSDSIWDELPKQISSFVAQYFPGEGLSSFSEEDGTYYVKVKSGPSMRFNSNYDWSEIDGNGQPLPSDLVFDEFPEPLYEYLESIEQVGQVYKVTRTRTQYHLTLEDSRLQYDISTRTITYPA